MDELRDRLARGDRTAFAELYDARAERIHHYLAALLGSRTDADDMLQETFVRLARDRERLSTVANLYPYLFTVARNEANRLIQRRSREGRSRTDLNSELPDPNHPREVEKREAAELIGILLERLEPTLREIVELKAFGGLTFREIGEVTDLPQGTVATRYRTALEKLRTLAVRGQP